MRFMPLSMFLIGLAGCATVTSKPVFSRGALSQNAASQEGFRYYLPTPYLLAKPSLGEGGARTVTLEITYLPDFCEQHAVSVSGAVSAVKSTLSLEEGWKLTSVAAELDSTKGAEYVKDLAVAVVNGLLAKSDAGSADGDSTEASTAAPASLAAGDDSQDDGEDDLAWLQPGLYSLFSRPALADGAPDCSAAPRFTPDPALAEQAKQEGTARAARRK